MQDEAKKRGGQLVYTDAAGSAAKQVADVNSMIAQGRRLHLPAAARGEAADPGDHGGQEGRHPGAADRPQRRPVARQGRRTTISPSSARTSSQEGQRVADWTIKKTGGKGKIIELEGTIGASPANDRKKGFDDTIKAKAPGMVILASQSGDFARDKGRQVAETLLQAHPDATIVYAHNDEMALGAIAAIEAAGKVPGKDILVVSIDGERTPSRRSSTASSAHLRVQPAVRAKGVRDHVSYANGDKIPPMIINPDRFFDASNAKEMLATAF